MAIRLEQKEMAEYLGKRNSGYVEYFTKDGSYWKMPLPIDIISLDLKPSVPIWYHKI